jgi:hypothetical protein
MQELADARGRAEATDPKVKSGLLEITRSYERVAELVGPAK